MFSLSTRLLLLGLLVSTACASESDAGDPPPAPETLFDALPAATPNKLRGVWQTTQQQPNGTVELRIRFVTGHLVGAAKCVAGGSDTAVLAGGSVALETTALDAATGKLTIGALALQKQEGNLVCQASLPAATYDFTIEGTTLTMAVGEAKLNTPFTKVGD